MNWVEQVLLSGCAVTAEPSLVKSRADGVPQCAPREPLGARASGDKLQDCSSAAVKRTDQTVWRYLNVIIRPYFSAPLHSESVTDLEGKCSAWCERFLVICASG